MGGVLVGGVEVAKDEVADVTAYTILTPDGNAGPQVVLPAKEGAISMCLGFEMWATY